MADQGEQASGMLLGSSKFIAKEELIKLVDTYMDRKFDEEITKIEECGGIDSFQEFLGVEFNTGLKTADINEERINAFGSNKKEEKKNDTFCELCWDALGDKILRILLVMGTLSLIIGATLEKHPEYAWIEGFAILMAVFIVVMVTSTNNYFKQKKFSELKNEHKNRALITVLRNGEYFSMHPSEVLVGDVVKLVQGEIIPADGILLKAQRLQTNESALTGENDNVDKEGHEECLKRLKEWMKKGTRAEGDHAKREIPSPIVISGTNVVEGSGEMVIIAVGQYSKEGRISGLAEQDEEMTPLEIKLEHLADRISGLGLGAGIFVVLILWLRFVIELGTGANEWDTGDSITDLIYAVIVGITVIAVAIPEGLPLAVTISLAYSVRKMQKEQNLVKRLHACETMGGADCICSDKTGTLTKNVMEVQRYSVDGSVYDQPRFKSLFEKHEDYFAFLKDAICLTSAARLEKNKKNDTVEIGSKTELAMIKMLVSLGHDDYMQIRQNVQKSVLVTNPFASKRKRGSVIVGYSEDLVRIYVVGASEYLVKSSKRQLSLDATQVDIDEDRRQSLKKDIETMAGQGLRTLGIAFKDLAADEMDKLNEFDKKGVPVLEKNGLTLLGIFGIYDPPRDEVTKAIQDCKTAYIKVRMVTGDNPITALAIARSIGIADDNSIAMIGEDFRKEVGGVICEECKTELCDCPRNSKNAGDKKVRNDVVGNFDSFKRIIGHLDVLARSQPEDKYTLVTGLKQMGSVVAVTGDGTNDAPALRKANVGFAMGIAGTELAQEVADIILLDDNFSSIVKAVKWGRSIYDNIQRFIQFQLTVNVVAVTCAIVGAVTVKQSPLMAIQLLWVNLIMDTFASLALATEPPTDALLKRRPHNLTDFIITPRMFKHIFGQAIMQVSILFALFYAGEYFIPEYGSGKRILYNPKSEDHVRSGRDYHFDGEKDYYDYSSDPDIGPSRMMTFIFNVFVLFQLFNEINSRKLLDEWWILGNICHTWLFMGIWFFTFGVQVIMVQVGSWAMGCHLDGLTVEQWFICIAWGFVPIVWRFLIILIPFKTKIQIDDNKPASHLASSIHKGSQSLKRHVTSNYNP
ncbi:unnamed protein product [Blepharisma stoltei]|uniref:P-type Ca(2+) transporter n=1 Tax=Blepharisma stoltei TaxID=1481888 RepID=A0AAU9IVT5_9CILI|nr:unnamed protein product [Blepharisma stoltei]